MTDAPTPRDVAASVLTFPGGGLLADAVMAALSAAGYVVAPREPTREMVDAAIGRCDDMDQADGLMFYGDIYRAMVDSLNHITDKQIAEGKKK